MLPHIVIAKPACRTGWFYKEQLALNLIQGTECLESSGNTLGVLRLSRMLNKRSCATFFSMTDCAGFI
jgi:hypothetical protein